VGGGKAFTLQSDLSIISFFWNDTKEGELPKRGTCENPGWMKDLYGYRKGVVPWRSLRK